VDRSQFGPAESELRKAANYLTFVAVSESESDLASVLNHWENFLASLDRVFNKIVATYKTSEKRDAWNGEHGKVISDRKQNVILSYLVHARNAHEHTIEEIVKHQPQSFIFTADENAMGPGRMRNLEIRAGQVSFDGENMKVSFRPDSVLAIPITDTRSGRVYNPPDGYTLSLIGKCGIDYYDDYLYRCIAHFVRSTGAE
jgi:hypothetical protein